jgi:hypothetical protein
LYEAPSVHCEDDDGEINDAKVDRVYPTRALAREHIEQRDPEIENHLLRLEEFTVRLTRRTAPNADPADATPKGGPSSLVGNNQNLAVSTSAVLSWSSETETELTELRSFASTPSRR